MFGNISFVVFHKFLGDRFQICFIVACEFYFVEVSTDTGRQEVR